MSRIRKQLAVICGVNKAEPCYNLIWPCVWEGLAIHVSTGEAASVDDATDHIFGSSILTRGEKEGTA